MTVLFYLINQKQRSSEIFNNFTCTEQDNFFRSVLVDRLQPMWCNREQYVCGGGDRTTEKLENSDFKLEEARAIRTKSLDVGNTFSGIVWPILDRLKPFPVGFTFKIFG